ncbi:hypothetical protein [Allokutzneria sp. NRRL B-24872]|uniref:hypothetical protein n=1 Tax=Allokutzneria sp. NRRL B-24872 TaxID=1137961 RepID=UPI001178599E|nr:hypothetical protein [Allokutzneria sp. NRRL B-24872]
MNKLDYALMALHSVMAAAKRFPGELPPVITDALPRVDDLAQDLLLLLCRYVDHVESHRETDTPPATVTFLKPR